MATWSTVCCSGPRKPGILGTMGSVHARCRISAKRSDSLSFGQRGQGKQAALSPPACRTLLTTIVSRPVSLNLCQLPRSVGTSGPARRSASSLSGSKPNAPQPALPKNHSQSQPPSSKLRFTRQRFQPLVSQKNKGARECTIMVSVRRGRVRMGATRQQGEAASVSRTIMDGFGCDQHVCMAKQQCSHPSHSSNVSSAPFSAVVVFPREVSCGVFAASSVG